MPTFRLLPLLLAACTVLGLGGARGEDAAVRELRIDPATTGVPLGKAKLSVDPLVRGKGADGLQAHYKVDVSPISLASEEGSLTISVDDETLRKLASGQPIDFSGQAVSTSGNNSAVRGTATPSKESKNTGAIRVHIDSKKGKLVFKTTYHLVP